MGSRRHAVPAGDRSGGSPPRSAAVAPCWPSWALLLLALALPLSGTGGHSHPTGSALAETGGSGRLYRPARRHAVVDRRAGSTRRRIPARWWRSWRPRPGRTRWCRASRSSCPEAREAARSADAGADGVGRQRLGSSLVSCGVRGAWLTMTGSSIRGWPRTGRPSGGGGSAAGCGHRFTTFERIDEIPSDGHQALRRPPAVRPGQGGRRAPGGHQEPPGDRGAARGAGPRGRGRAAGGRRRADHPNRWDWPCSSACGWSTKWPTSGSPACTRGSRASTTSDARSGS